MEELSNEHLLYKYVLSVLESGAIVKPEKTAMKEEILRRMDSQTANG